MKKEAAQKILSSIFAVSFVMGIALCFLVLADKAIYVEESFSLLNHLLAIYSVPLASIIAGMYARQHIHSSDSMPALNPTGSIAFVLIWNGMMIAPLAILKFTSMFTYLNVVAYYEKVAPYTIFLMAAIVTYYFAKE